MTPRVLAFMLHRGGSDARRVTMERTLREAREKAAYDATWEVWDNTTRNVGQHTAFNAMLDKAAHEGYDYLLRLDDDVEFMTQRWLAKMVEAATKLGPRFILSPTVKGLKHPPEMSQSVEVAGVWGRFMTQAIGGACRLHPVATLVEGRYVSDVRLPLGFGDATGIMRWAMAQQPAVYAMWLDHVRVRHATERQEEEDATYHDVHGTLQRVPYIPVWPHDYPTQPQLHGGAYATMPHDYVERQRAFNLAHRDGSLEHEDEAAWVAHVVQLICAHGRADVASVLDVGCRAGASLVALQGAWEGARVVGVDVVEEFVAHAREKGCDARVADMHALPFGDGEFEWVVCNGTLEHAYSVDRALGEMSRVVTRGIYVTADLRAVPLGSDYAHTTDPAAWRTAIERAGLRVVHEAACHAGVEFVAVKEAATCE